MNYNTDNKKIVEVGFLISENNLSFWLDDKKTLEGKIELFYPPFKKVETVKPFIEKPGAESAVADEKKELETVETVKPFIKKAEAEPAVADEKKELETVETVKPFIKKAEAEPAVADKKKELETVETVKPFIKNPVAKPAVADEKQEQETVESIIKTIGDDVPVLIFKDDDVESKLPLRVINLNEKCKIGCEKKRDKKPPLINNMLFDSKHVDYLGFEYGYFVYDHLNNQVKNILSFFHLFILFCIFSSISNLLMEKLYNI
jgi:hypothetical protein